MSATQSAPWYSPLLSLRWRLAVVYSALFGIFVVLLSIFLYSSISNLLLHNAQQAFPTRARALHTLLIQEICSTTSPPSLTSFIQQNVPGDVDQIYFLNARGIVVASSDYHLFNRQFPYLSSSSFSTPPGKTTRSFTGPVASDATSAGLLFSLQPTPNCLSTSQLPAYMAVLTMYNDEQSTLRTILLMLGITSAFMIGLGALIISFFTGVMFKPLHQVTRATRELAQGNLEQRVPPLQSNDEIAILATSFNQMADRIQHMFAAQQASKRRAQRFVSDASHELRTPITSLRGFTEVLIRGAKDDPETAQRVLGLMKNEAERMTDLVNDLLTLARLDEGYIPDPEEVDLVELVIECQQQMRKKAPGTYQLSLELVTNDRHSIYASREQIKQMLLVLLENAVKYGCSGEENKVLLRLDKLESHVQLQIIDYGEGITNEDLPHVFERFYRGRNAVDRLTPIPGTGLGLPIAQAIAQAYRGAITVCSVPAQGTIFTASFPCL
ncbi:MAG TPA: HAMP domain-containing sensor histidine kinase [Ktedonobacteraceae bacterium]